MASCNCGKRKCPDCGPRLWYPTDGAGADGDDFYDDEEELN